MNREEFDEICQSVMRHKLACDDMIMMPVDDYNKLVGALNQYPASMQEEIDRLKDDVGVWRVLAKEAKESFDECLAENKQLQAEVEALKGQWISVDDRLPKRYQEVFIKFSDGVIRMGRLNNADVWELASFNIRKASWGRVEAVVAWAEPPKTKESESND